MEPESALIVRVAQGDTGALRDLYERLSGNVFALVLAMLRSREDAEEVVQDTFVKLHRNAGRYRPDRGSARAWIYTIARNEARMRLRARSSRPRKTDSVDVHHADAPLAAQEQRDPVANVTVERAMAVLTPEDAALVRGSFFLGLSHAELAERNRLPLGTVKSRIRRALIAMRERLGES